MKVAFLGYGEIGAAVLTGLVTQHEVIVVVTHELSFGGLNEDHVGSLSSRLELPTLYARNAGADHVVRAIKDCEPEVLVSANWRTAVPETVLEIPSRYPVNIHDALLPGYAGFGSVNWAIRNGETRIGLTVHVMEAELDTGPVLHTVVVPIDAEDTAGIVYARLLREYPGGVLTALDLIADGIRPVPQPTVGASFYHRITEADNKIDWSLSTTRLVNLIRAQSDPFRNAWCTVNGEKLYVKRAKRPVRSYRGTPGRVVRNAEGGVAIVCGPSWEADSNGIILLEIQREGHRPQPAAQYLTKLGIQLH